MEKHIETQRNKRESQRRKDSKRKFSPFLCIYSLSGFLGLPEDWNSFSSSFIGASSNQPILFNPIDWQQFLLKNLTDWGTEFNRYVSTKKEPRVLMGYSMGGRLGLHAILQDPQLWTAAIFISTHPGLSTIDERAKRKKTDGVWAKKFENEQWTTVIDDWNSQEVFKNQTFNLETAVQGDRVKQDFKFDRHESHYDRQKLASALRSGSLGEQEDLRGAIASLPFPILWLTGANDKKFCDLAAGIAFKHPLSSWKVIENAGHRLPWSNPKDFIENVQDFFSSIV